MLQAITQYTEHYWSPCHCRCPCSPRRNSNGNSAQLPLRTAVIWCSEKHVQVFQIYIHLHHRSMCTYRLSGCKRRVLPPRTRSDIVARRGTRSPRASARQLTGSQPSHLESHRIPHFTLNLLLSTSTEYKDRNTKYTHPVQLLFTLAFLGCWFSPWKDGGGINSPLDSCTKECCVLVFEFSVEGHSTTDASNHHTMGRI
jgi:hypothetical protein